MLKYLLTMLTIACVASCATPSIDRDFVLSPSSRQGVVATSLTYDGRLSGYGVWYRQVPAGESGKLETGQGMVLVPRPVARDFSDPATKGELIAAALPAGEYEIYWWQVASGYARVNPAVPFSIRFKLDPGSLVYIGNFHFVQTATMGLTVTGVTVTYRDATERDLEVLKQKYPTIAQFPISHAIAKGLNHAGLGGQASATFTIPPFIPTVKR